MRLIITFLRILNHVPGFFAGLMVCSLALWANNKWGGLELNTQQFFLVGLASAILMYVSHWAMVTSQSNFVRSLMSQDPPQKASSSQGDTDDPHDPPSEDP